MKQRIIELENLLNDYEYHYRVLDNPLVSDEEYDNLFNEYKNLVKEYPQFKTENSPLNKVGSVLVGGFQKVEHKHLMGSLENTYSIDEFLEWVNKLENELGKELLFNVEDKFDGISLSLIYKNGKLTDAITRGDGKIGDSIYNNAKMISNMILDMNNDFSGEIRGEAIILKKDVDRINKLENTEFKNPRNLVAGTLKSLDSNIVKNRFVHFIPYYFYDETFNEIDGKQFIKLFKINGFSWEGIKFNLNKENIINNIKSSEDNNSEYYHKNREYPVDGLVIKISDYDIRKKLGYTSSCPKWAKAFKFKQEKAVTTVKDITWQVGRDRITPVAELEPVELEGTTVSRATIHNVTQLKRLGVTKDCKVEIEKAAFIIPYINKVVEQSNNDIFIPNKCPICGAETKIEKLESEILICTNNNCKAKLKSNIEYSIKALEIDEIGESLISELVEKEIVKTPLDVLKLTENDLRQCERMGKTKINKILNNLSKAVCQPFNKIIEFLGIKEVGKITSEKIANHFNTINDLYITDNLLKVDDIGDVIADNIIEYIKNNTDYIKQINDFFIVKAETKSSNKLENKNFVVTGSATKSRDFIEKLIKSNGGKVSSGVSSKTDILIIGSLESDSFNSTKKKKAIELNKEIHNELWLFDLLDLKEDKEEVKEKEITLNDLF